MVRKKTDQDSHRTHKIKACMRTERKIGRSERKKTQKIDNFLSVNFVSVELL